jgi:hypothetical protein
MPFSMLFFKKRRSSKKKELGNNLQGRVECLKKRVDCLEGKLDEIMAAIRYGGRTQRKQETKEIQDFEDYEVNVNREDVMEEREQTCKDDSVGETVHVVVTVDVHREDLNEVEEELEQIGKEETVLGCVEVVNGQEDKLEQTGEAECAEETVLDCVECVNEQEDTFEQTGEAECAEETACLLMRTLKVKTVTWCQRLISVSLAEEYDVFGINLSLTHKYVVFALVVYCVWALFCSSRSVSSCVCRWSVYEVG